MDSGGRRLAEFSQNTVPGPGEIVAHYTADPGHCSDIEVRMASDNPTYGSYTMMPDWVRLGPGQTADTPKVDVAAGGPHSSR